MMLKKVNHRFYIYAISCLILTVLLVVFASSKFPKYHGMLQFIILMVIMDFYLWKSLRTSINKFNIIFKSISKIIYWLPLTIVITFVLSSIIINIKDWDQNIRTYLTGFIMVFFTAKTIAVIFLFIADIFRFFRFVWYFLFKRNAFYSKFKNKRPRFILYIGNTLSFIIFFTMLYGMIFTEFNFKVRRVELSFPNLPTQFNGYKIVQLSDMHLGSWYSEKPLQNAVNIINDLHPDLICFTGDLVNFSTDEAFRFENTLKQIHSPNGVYSILGNHDYGNYVKWKTDKEKDDNMKAMYDLQKRLGWHLLLNANDSIIRDSASIIIAGVENWGFHPRFPKYGDIDKAINNIDTNKFIILLSHDPSHWQYIINPKYPFINLTLSGHTHGMQMGITTNKNEWSPAKYMYKYWAGLYTSIVGNRSQYLYVNRGLGVIGYPGRLGMPPEITIIELKRK